MVILVVKHGCSGFLGSSAIFVGIIAGYIAAIIMGMVLPTTAVDADGVEFTKAWVLNWDKVAQASWFAVPKLIPVKPVFDLRAILPVLVMFIVTAVETVSAARQPIRSCPAALPATVWVPRSQRSSACSRTPRSARTLALSP